LVELNDDDELQCTGAVDTSSIIASIDIAFSATLLLVFLCRVARTWNQTGDKWAHLPDVSDWLVRQVFIYILLHLYCTQPAYTTYTTQCHYNKSRLMVFKK